MTNNQMSQDEADKNRKRYLFNEILRTPLSTRNDYIKYWEKTISDLKRWQTIIQASKDTTHVADLIKELNEDESWRFCQALEDVNLDVACDKDDEDLDPHKVA